MRHARAEALDQLSDVLATLRTVPGLVEKSSGVFYRRSRAFVHFHEDPTGLYADVRGAEEFERLRVTTPDEQAAFLELVLLWCGGSG